MDMDGPMIEEAPSSSASSTPSSSSSFSSSSLSSTAMQRHRQDRYYPEPRGLVSCLPSSSLLLMGAKGEDDLSVTSSSSAWSSTEEDEEFSAFKDGGKDRKEVDEEEGKRRRRRIRRTRLVACLGYILGERGDPEKVNGKRKIDCRSAPGGMPSQEEATRKTDGKEKQYLSFSSSPFTSTPPPLPGAFFNPCDPSSSSCCLSRDPTPPGKDEEARETPRFLPSSCCSCPSPNTRVTEGYEIPLPEAFHVLYQLHSHAKISLCSSNGAPLRSSSLSPRNEERKEEDARRTSSSSCHKHSAMCASQTSLRRLTSFERSSQAKPPSPSVSSRSSFPSSPPPPPLNPKVEGSLPTVRRYPRRSTRIASSFACAQNSSSSFCFRDHRKQERENEGSEGLKKEVNDPSDKASLGKGRKTPFYPCLDSQQIPLLLPPVLGEDFDRSRHEEYNRISQLEERKQSQDDTEDDGGMVGCLSREEEERSSSTRREHTVPGSKEDAKSVGPLRVGQEEEEEEEQRSCREKTDEENEKEGHISKQDGLLSFNTRKAKTWEDRGVMNPAILLDDVSSESRFHSSSSSSFSERESKISPVFFICKDWGLGELLRDPVGLYTLGKLPISPCRKWRVSYSSFSSSSSSVFSSTAVSSLSKRKEEGEEERHTVRATAREKEKVIIEPVKNDIGRCTEEAERVKAKYSAEDGDTRDFGEIENDRKTERTGKKEERRSDTCDGNDENSASYTPMKMQEGGEVKDEESREKEADRIRKMGKASQELNKKKRKTPRKPAYILHKEAEFATKLQYLNEWKEILKSLEEDRCLFQSSSSIEKGDVNTLREERREDQEAEKREEKKACQEKVANKGEDENVLVGLKDSKRRFVGPAVLQALRLLPLWTLLRCIDTLECV
ncbi:hypothetical protein CSUI_011192 [Cystoisospora suis]|uniref:Uncharacterized protein n=1 Tax=Cystoisospora suis TaxID=483139 RepID=A0A2C6KEC7_9APIC|nr:hypothetical protein CSUI_011192 [Cystoisospora suis]